MEFTSCPALSVGTGTQPVGVKVGARIKIEGGASVFHTLAVTYAVSTKWTHFGVPRRDAMSAFESRVRPVYRSQWPKNREQGNSIGTLEYLGTVKVLDSTYKNR